jgi:hypothetical protein
MAPGLVRSVSLGDLSSALAGIADIERFADDTAGQRDTPPYASATADLEFAQRDMPPSSACPAKNTLASAMAGSKSTLGRSVSVGDMMSANLSVGAVKSQLGGARLARADSCSSFASDDSSDSNSSEFNAACAAVLQRFQRNSASFQGASDAEGALETEV